MTISKSIQAACGMTISKDKVTSSIKYGHCMSLSNSLFVCFKFAIFTHRVDVQKKHSIPRHLPCILNFNQLQRKKDMSYLLDPPESNLTMVFFSTKWGFPWFSKVFPLKAPGNVQKPCLTTGSGVLKDHAQELHFLHANDLPRLFRQNHWGIDALSQWSMRIIIKWGQLMI